MCEQITGLYRKAYEKMSEAADQSHTGHWDLQGTHGRNCPECIRTRELRREADALFDRAEKLSKNITR